MTASLGNAKLASCSWTVNVASEPTVTAKTTPSTSPVDRTNAAASVGAAVGVAIRSALGARVGVAVGSVLRPAVGVAVGSSLPQEAAKSSMTSSKGEMDMLTRGIVYGMGKPLRFLVLLKDLDDANAGPRRQLQAPAFGVAPAREARAEDGGQYD